MKGMTKDGYISQESMLKHLTSNVLDVYVYFVKGRRGVFSKAMSDQFGIPQEVRDFPDWNVDKGAIAPESMEEWYGLFNAIDRGEHSGTAIVNFNQRGGVRRYRLRFTGVYDEQGLPSSAIISTEDVTIEQEQLNRQALDVTGLLQAARKVFPEILTLNITKNTYRMIQYDQKTTQGTPQEGLLLDMLNIRLPYIAEEDRDAFIDMFYPAGLKRAFIDQGEESVTLTYRRLDKGGTPYWFETTVMRQQNPIDDDVLVVAMSRNIDAQKAEETRLREEVRLNAEEIRITMTQMGKLVCYYDVPTRTLTVPPQHARRMGMSSKAADFPFDDDKYAHPGIDGAGRAAILAFYRDICDGKRFGTCEYHVVDSAGEERWERLESMTIFDSKGQPTRAVVAVEDVTESYMTTEENQRLKENERILRLINRHSDRSITFYDLTSGKVRFWDEEALADMGASQSECDMDRFLSEEFIAPDSRQDAEAIMEDISRGSQGGEAKLKCRNSDGSQIWVDIKYSTLFDEGDKPTAVLFSHKDVTEQYERELTYRRYVKALEEDDEARLLVIEVDLTQDVIEKVGGHLLPGDIATEGLSLTEFGEMMIERSFLEEDRQQAAEHFSRKNLLEQYALGRGSLKSMWHLRFSTGEMRWVSCDINLLDDPYGNHIKAFFRLKDVTEEQEERLAIRNRSERDGLTGLLNRATCEELIRRAVAEGGDKGGILLILDLDELKHINDTFGHEQGDRAIKAIADTLRAHFRESDIVGRMGGDEFLVFLPGAADNINAISASVAALLRKLAGIPVGSRDEQRIHCSVGCSVQLVEWDTFEGMYKRADLALYHVKRSGKNNFAFFSTEMERTDYQFKKQKLLSFIGDKSPEWKEMQHLLHAISSFYPLVLSANLSVNDCFLMEAADVLLSALPSFGTVDDFIGRAAQLVHADDQELYYGSLSRDNLLRAYAEGQPSVRCYVRSKDPRPQRRWAEVIVIFYENEKGEVCDYTLMRWASERESELHMMWLQKVMELAVVSSFEYICMVDVRGGAYTIYGNDGRNTHAIREASSFEEATRKIRDDYIPLEQREEYYQRASLASVTAHMEREGSYSYRYHMPDGEREAAFYWFEPTHAQLLMTVRRC